MESINPALDLLPDCDALGGFPDRSARESAIPGMPAQLTENNGGRLSRKATRRRRLGKAIAFGSGFTPGEGLISGEFLTWRRTDDGTERALAGVLVTC